MIANQLKKDDFYLPIIRLLGRLAEGAVCFVGRDDRAKPAIPFVLTEGAWDGGDETLATVDIDTIFPTAKPAFEHVTTTSELTQKVAKGLSLDSVGAKWSTIETTVEGLTGMALIAWNAPNVGAELNTGEARRAGLLVHVHDRQAEDASGRRDAVQQGLVAAEAQEPQAEVDPAP